MATRHPDCAHCGVPYADHLVLHGRAPRCPTPERQFYQARVDPRLRLGRWTVYAHTGAFLGVVEAYHKLQALAEAASRWPTHRTFRVAVVPRTTADAADLDTEGDSLRSYNHQHP